MGKLLYELTESVRIALAQIRANKMRSALTALGVIASASSRCADAGHAIRGIDTWLRPEPLPCS